MSGTDHSSEAIIPEIKELNLTSQSVMLHFFSKEKRAQLVTYLLALDRLDSWTVDYNEMSASDTFDLQLYLTELTEFLEASVSVLHRVPEDMAEQLAHLTTTRCMYLIRYIAQNNPEFLDKLSFAIEADDGSDVSLSVIRKRFEAFSRAQLLGEMFSNARLKKITTVMRAN